MARMTNVTLVVLIAAMTAFGCAHGSSGPTQPGSGAEPPDLQVTSDSGRALLGVWDVYIDPYSSTAEVQPSKWAAAHGNYSPQLPPPFIVFDPDHGYDAFFSTWNVDIIVQNTLDHAILDVRGIVFINDGSDDNVPIEPGDALGIRNADGQTTLWDQEAPVPEYGNPFKYFGNLAAGELGTQIYYIVFEPNPDPGINCELEEHPAPEPPDPQAVQFVFAIEAYYDPAQPDEHCPDPYMIDNFMQNVIPLEPGGMGAVSFDVFDWQNDVISVDMICPEIPELEDATWTWSGDKTWTASFVHQGFDHEFIADATIVAVSAEPAAPDPVTDPNTLYKDVRIRVGNMRLFLRNLFKLNPADIVTVQNDWDDRVDDWVVSDEFEVVDTKSMGYFQTYVWFHHKMKNPDTGEKEWHNAAVRIPPTWGQPPDKKWPVLVYAHFGDFIAGDPNEGNPEGVPAGFPNGPHVDLTNDYVHLLPVCRGNWLCWDDILRPQPPELPEGEMSNADYDVDDILVCLETFLDNADAGEVFERADPEKIFVMGGSRGGSRAYLAKIRDSLQDHHPPRLDGAIIFIGSIANFFHPTIRNAARDYIYIGYKPYDPANPDDHYFNEDRTFFVRVLEEYFAGNMNLDDCHLLMTRSSPIYFFGPDGVNLTKTQLHHGTADDIARFEQSEAVYMMGLSPDVLEPRPWPGWGHWYAQEQLYQYAIRDFLDHLWD